LERSIKRALRADSVLPPDAKTTKLHSEPGSCNGCENYVNQLKYEGTNVLQQQAAAKAEVLDDDVHRRANASLSFFAAANLCALFVSCYNAHGFTAFDSALM